MHCFGYRYSSFQDDIVVSATFKFPVGDKSGDETSLSGASDFAGMKRSQMSPPNTGSIFKNPVMNSAGRLIENCGLKGFRIGNAEISEKHANFIVNLGGASAIDVLQIMHRIEEEVQSKFGVMMEFAVRMLGFPEGISETDGKINRQRSMKKIERTYLNFTLAVCVFVALYLISQNWKNQLVLHDVKVYDASILTDDEVKTLADVQAGSSLYGLSLAEISHRVRAESFCKTSCRGTRASL